MNFSAPRRAILKRFSSRRAEMKRNFILVAVALIVVVPVNVAFQPPVRV